MLKCKSNGLLSKEKKASPEIRTSYDYQKHKKSSSGNLGNLLRKSEKMIRNPETAFKK